MSAFQDKFDQAVWRVVAGIVPGTVMGYGEVARAAGFPRHARMVSRAMGRSAAPLPWYRVVRSNRTLAFTPGSEAWLRQKSLLESEGVQLKNGKVICAVQTDSVDLDRLLWGPAEE
ncbi:MAG: MGMT family protein [Gammaproteobacteria bacterium]|nr:MGMT family protein [Gammaproteobacteria bacterium]MDH5650620.1 MGMT family protein [Gammaproteobacteria bacterium]